MEGDSIQLTLKDRLTIYYKRYMFVVGVVGQLLYYMQAVKIFVEKSATSVSLTAFFFGFFSVASWLVYGVIIKDKVLIVANAFAVLGALLTIIGIFIYG